MGIFPICDEQKYMFDVNEAVKSVPMKLLFSAEFSERFTSDELCHAVEKCIQSADILSARCVVKGGRQYMEFLPPQKPEIHAFHFSTEEDYLIFRDKIIETEINNRDKLYNIFVFSISGSLRNKINFCFNHLVFDGISHLIFRDQIPKILINKNTEITWHPFSAYLKKIDRYKKSPKYLADQEFWEDRFREISKCEHVFPQLVDIDESTIRVLEFHSSKTFKTELLAYCLHHRNSPHLFIVTILAQFIHKKTGCKLFCFDIPIGNRSGAKEKNSIGLYEIGLPYIFDFYKNADTDDLLESLQKQSKQYYRHKNFDWYTRMHSEPFTNTFGSYFPQFMYSYLSYSKDYAMPFATWRLLYPERTCMPISLYISDFIDHKAFTFSYLFWKHYFSDDEIVEMHKEIEEQIFNLMKQWSISAQTR